MYAKILVGGADPTKTEQPRLPRLKSSIISPEVTWGPRKLLDIVIPSPY